MHYAIDDNLLARLKAIAASDPANTDVLDALAAAEGDPLLEGLFWKRSAVLRECRNLLMPRSGMNNVDPAMRDPEFPFDNQAREALAQYLAGGPVLYLPGVIDEVQVEMSTHALDAITHAVEVAAKRERIPKRTIKAILADDWRMTCAVQNLSEEAINVGILASAKAVLDELSAAFALDPKSFRRAAKSTEDYLDLDDFADHDDW